MGFYYLTIYNKKDNYMVSLNNYYINECAEFTIMSKLSDLLERKLDGDEFDIDDVDMDGLPDEVHIDFEKILDNLDIDDEDLDESMKARAPKLIGRAEKSRKNKAKLMSALKKNPDIIQAIARLKQILLRTARSEAQSLGINNRAITKALKGKVRI